MSESANERFERLAAEFYQDTGVMAPGKDAPMGFCEDRERRQDMWNAWNKGRARGEKAMTEAREILRNDLCFHKNPSSYPSVKRVKHALSVIDEALEG